jgi:hypothetical protein
MHRVLNVFPVLKGGDFLGQEVDVPTRELEPWILSLRISDCTLPDTGNLEGPTAPMAFSPGGSEAAVNFYGFIRGPFPSNRSRHDCKQCSWASVTPPGCGECQ